MGRETITERVERCFPGDTALIGYAHHAEQRGNWRHWLGDLATKFRSHPQEAQTTFFLSCLEERFADHLLANQRIWDDPDMRELIFAKGLLVKTSEIPRPNLKATAMIMTEINSVPLRTEGLSKAEIAGLAEQHTVACRLDLKRPPLVVLVEDVDKMTKLANYLALQSRLLPKSVFDKRNSVLEPWSWSITKDVWLDRAGSLGLGGFVGSIIDDAHNNYFLHEVVQGVLEGMWDFNQEQRQGYSNKTWYGNKGEHIPHNLYASLHNAVIGGVPADAVAWETMKDIMAAEGYPANPCLPFWKILRPGLWPLGYDHDRNKFYVAVPPGSRQIGIVV